MNMSLEELDALQPDLIILDEFHRAGAAEWSKGVNRLIELYPEAMLLGLSATHIRYLDNQRDMADELFGKPVEGLKGEVCDLAVCRTAVSLRADDAGGRVERSQGVGQRC
ncbi:MAG: DEAD/DEAH box helicase family protein [Merdibacter sp.]